MTPAGATILTAWTPDPVSVLVLAALAWAYLRGAVRQYAREGELADWRPMLFLGGLFVIAVAMVSPFAALAHQAAWLHQVQGAMLRVIAPLAIFVTRPQRLIYTGLPKALRSGLFARLWRAPALNRLGGLLATPLVAGALNIASFIFWILPQPQDAALTHALVGFAERVSELAAGCLFFGVLFDARDPDLGGTRYGPRIVMLITTTLVMVVLGVALTVKPMLFYTAYPDGVRIPYFAPLDDEATGGFVNWAWVSLVYLMTFILVFVRWNAAEVRAYARAMSFSGSNSAALRLPETAEELWLLVTPLNRRLGLSLSIIPAVMMFLAIAIVVTLHYRA